MGNHKNTIEKLKRGIFHNELRLENPNKQRLEHYGMKTNGTQEKSQTFSERKERNRRMKKHNTVDL